MEVVSLMACRTALTRALATLSITGMIFSATPQIASAQDSPTWQRHRSYLAQRARSVMGTRYSYGGTSPSSGFDCSGFTRWVFSNKVALPHSSMDQFNMAGRSGYKRVWKIKNLERGDLVFFKTTSARVGHAGMFIGRGRFIHSSSSGGSVKISSIWDRYYYKPRFVGAVRTPFTQRYKG
jgi:cell wall-associated NlpC family hydrolase